MIFDPSPARLKVPSQRLLRWLGALAGMALTNTPISPIRQLTSKQQDQKSGVRQKGK